MNRSSLTFLCILISLSIHAQKYIDSLRQELTLAKQDSDGVNTLCRIADYFANNNADSNTYYVGQAIKLSRSINYPRGILLAHIAEFFKINSEADYPRALEIAQNNLLLAESLPNDRLANMAYIHNNLYAVKMEMGDTIQARKESMEAIELQKSLGKIDGDLSGIIFYRARIFEAKKNKDSALILGHQAVELVKTAPFRRIYSSIISAFLAEMYLRYQMYNEARHYYQQGLEQAQYYGNRYIEARINMNLMQFSINTNRIDSAIYFANKALLLCSKFHFGDYASTVADSLSKIYEKKGKVDSALWYMKVMATAKDSIFSQAKMQAFQRLISENDQRQREAAAAQERLENKIKLYASLSGIAVFLMLSGILYRNNRQKQRAFITIRKQKQETDFQKAKVEEAFQELKSTQKQLIQSEKMASLGELTAGIAHEIQNPLNFVNNFADVNDELIDEMKSELNAGHIQEAFDLANGIQENERKIKTHGQRADAIVKGMLQHSRSTSSQKESTDINLLAADWLRLSYHSMKAKDASFNAHVESDWDESIPKINIVPQDIARVFANLFNNAFYAVNEKYKKTYPQHGYEEYVPSVKVMTKQLSSHLGKKCILVSVKDNGNGIKQQIVEKIFQPFFTTKPTGQGTGLGLSLAYDIVKAHGGEIRVESEEGMGAEFIVELRVNLA
jgi:signal transduction histidine kinase